MSDIKFSCPHCGQHLSVDSTSAGATTKCPSCEGQLVVPGSARVAGAPPPPLPTPRPMPGAAPAHGRAAGPTRTSGLAIASIICSIGSFLCIPFGFIPGIICGHMARKRLDQEPGLEGRGLAKAGIIIGYVGLGIYVLAIIGAVLFSTIFASKLASITRQPSLRSTPTAPMGSPRQEQALPADTPPDGSGWTLNLQNEAIPAGNVTGRIRGQEFSAENVEIQNGWLKFRQGSGFSADREIQIVLFVSKPDEIGGKTYNIRPGDSGMHPHIWMHSKKAEGNGRDSKAYMSGYAMRLEFGEPSGGKLPGKVYLCLADPDKSFIKGTFEAQIK